MINRTQTPKSSNAEIAMDYATDLLIIECIMAVDDVAEMKAIGFEITPCPEDN